MNAAPSSLPPPLPPKNASSLAFLLNGVLALFIADAGMSLLDDTLVAFAGLHLVSGIRALLALLTGGLALLTYLLIGLMPRIPKSLFLPVTLFNPVALLVAIPLEIYFFQHLPWIAWVSSLVQVIVAFYLVSRLQPKMWPRWPLMPSGSLGSRRFSWRHSLTFVGINMLLLVPLVGLYLGFCAHLAVDHFSAGFVGLKFDRLTMQAKTYSRADGKSVTLVPMMHIGESSFYEEIAKTFATNSIVLLEGVSDSKSLLRQKLSYKRMAESLGLSEQHQSFEPTQGTLRMADVDVSSFSQSTVKLLNLVTTLHAGKATPQTFLQFMQQCQDLNVARGLWSDILLKRNEHLLQEIKQALTESEIIIVPWGAAHMPGISSGVESFGFHPKDQKEFVVVRFSGVFSKLRASRTENR